MTKTPGTAASSADIANARLVVTVRGHHAATGTIRLATGIEKGPGTGTEIGTATASTTGTETARRDGNATKMDTAIETATGTRTETEIKTAFVTETKTATGTGTTARPVLPERRNPPPPLTLPP